MKNAKVVGLVIFIVLVMGFSIIAGATQEAITTQVYVYGGDLTESFSPLTQQTLTLTGKDGLTTSFTPIANWKISDARGTGAGWLVNISADSITDGSKTIDLSNLTVSVDQILKSSDGQSSSDPAKISAANGQALTTGVTLLQAGSSEGMGSFEYSPTFNLKIPASAYAGNYTCNLTTTILPSGPAQ